VISVADEDAIFGNALDIFGHGPKPSINQTRVEYIYLCHSTISSFLPSDSVDAGLSVPMLGDLVSDSYNGIWNFDSIGTDASFQQGLHLASIGSLGSHISEADICAYQKAQVHIEPRGVHHACLQEGS
jgi:hypothetical protein